MKALSMAKDLSDCRVAVLGLGLMGGSLALALRGRCRELVGYDPDPQTVKQARSAGIVDQASTSVESLLGGVDLDVLAAPVQANLDWLDRLPGLIPDPVMVIDLGSTKALIVQKMSTLPDRFDPIGGHPMCGKEHSGLANAEPQIYMHAPFALTPLQRSSPIVRGVALQLVKTIGAEPVWVEAEIHDQWVAMTSHVPYLIANALAAEVPRQAFSLVGPGLRSTIRLAPTPWSIIGDILITNRRQILSGLAEFRQRVQIIERLLEAEDFQGLEACLSQGSENYENLVRQLR